MLESPVTPEAGQVAPAAEDSKPRFFYGYWLIVAAFVGQLVSVGSQAYTVGAFLKPMNDDLGWTRSEFTLSRTIAQFIMAFTGFFIGSIVDREGGRRLMLAGTVILTASLWAQSYTQELWQWMILNGIVVTIGAAFVGNLVVNVTLSKWFVEKRGFAVSYASMGVSFAGIALTPLMTEAVDAWGWRDAWRVLAVVSAVLVLPAALLMRRAPEDYGLYPDGKSAEEVAAGQGSAMSADFAASFTRAQAVRSPAFYMLVLAFGMFSVTIGVMLLQTIPFMTDAGYTRGTASFMITLSSIPALLSKPLWGYLMDKWDAKKLSSIGAVVTGASLITITLSVESGTDPMIWLGFFLLGFGWGGMVPLQEVIWATFFGRRYIGAVRSAGLPFSLVIAAGAPQLVSYYYDQVGNYNGAFLAIAASNLAAGVLLWYLKSPRRTAPAPA